MIEHQPEERADSGGPGAVPELERTALELELAAALEAIEALAGIKDPVSASALLRISERAARPEVRKAARRGLHRLQSAGVAPVQVEVVPERPEPKAWPPYRALSSPIDGSGSRGFWLGFQRSGEIDLLYLLIDEKLGLEDAGSRDMSKSRFDKETARLQANEKFPWVEIPFDYGRHLIEQAARKNASSGESLPLEYMAWRDRIGRPEQDYPQPIVYTVLNAAEVRWDPRFLDSSGGLLGLDIFSGWYLEPNEVSEFVRENVIAEQSGLVLAGPREGDRDRMAEDRAIQKLFAEPRRLAYKARLEETSYILWKLGRVEHAKVALAAALGLDSTGQALMEHPFVRSLVDLSLDIAYVQAQGEHVKSVKPGVKLHLPY